MKKKLLLTTLAGVGLLLTLSQCKKNTAEDKALFERSVTTSGFTYYMGNDSIRPSSSPSAHNQFFRVRFNATALAALTDNGRLPQGGSFPEGSLIVKELYDQQNGSIALLAVMEKAPGNSAAGAGWLWAEYEADGETVFSTSKKGDGCISCHSSGASRDYTRVFDLF